MMFQASDKSAQNACTFRIPAATHKATTLSEAHGNTLCKCNWHAGSEQFDWTIALWITKSLNIRI